MCGIKLGLKRKLYRLALIAVYLVMRPFGKIPVRLGGISAKFHFNSLDDLTRALTFAGERRVFAGLLQHVQQGDTVWDVGANVGTHTVMFSKKVGPDGKVIAFEPETGVRETLERNIRLNQLSNVKVAPFALGNSDSTGEIFVDAHSGSGKHSLVPVSDYQRQKVEVRSGDRIVELDSTVIPDMVKIDVEGFELEVLRGISATLATKQCRLIMCEVHTRILQRNGEDPDFVEQLLVQAGFSTFERNQRGNETHILALKSS